eukprot:PhM_4_TR10558/c0_g1_i1/m.60557
MSGQTAQEDLDLPNGTWCLWYAQRPTPEQIKLYGKYDAQEKIAQNLNEGAPIHTLRQFWGNFLALPKLTSLPHFHKVTFMRSDLTPSWHEDLLVQRKGGVISLCFNKVCANEVAEYILMCLIAGLINIPRDDNDKETCELCGVSFMCGKRWDAGTVKEWLECAVYHDCEARDKEILAELEKAVRGRVKNFEMTQEVKYHKLEAKKK